MRVYFDKMPHNVWSPLQDMGLHRSHDSHMFRIGSEIWPNGLLLYMWLVFSHDRRDVVGEGNGNPLQYSCLENSMDRGTWQATGHGGWGGRCTESETTERLTYNIYRETRNGRSKRKPWAHQYANVYGWLELFYGKKPHSIVKQLSSI